MNNKKVFIAIGGHFATSGYSFALAIKEENKMLPIEDVRFMPNPTKETYFAPFWTGELDLQSMIRLKEFAEKAIEALKNGNNH